MADLLKQLARDSRVKLFGSERRFPGCGLKNCGCTPTWRANSCRRRGTPGAKCRRRASAGPGPPPEGEGGPDGGHGSGPAFDERVGVSAEKDGPSAARGTLGRQGAQPTSCATAPVQAGMGGVRVRMADYSTGTGPLTCWRVRFPSAAGGWFFGFPPWVAVGCGRVVRCFWLPWCEA